MHLFQDILCQHTIPRHVGIRNINLPLSHCYHSACDENLKYGVQECCLLLDANSCKKNTSTFHKILEKLRIVNYLNFLLTYLKDASETRSERTFS